MSDLISIFFVSIGVCSCLYLSRHRERPLVDVFDMARLRLQAPVRRPNSRNMEPRNLLRIHDSLQLKYPGNAHVFTVLYCKPTLLAVTDWFACVFVRQTASPGWDSVRFPSRRKWACRAGGGGTTGIHITSSAARGLQSRMVRAHFF